MKKQIAAYIRELKAFPHYCGKKKIMYITDPLKEMALETVEEIVLAKFGYGVPFKLQTN